MTLGNKISQYRKNLELTQEMLAQKLEVTNQAVSKWESDQCCPDVLLLPKLADVFKISMDELFDRSYKPQPGGLPELPWEDDGVLRVALYIGREMIAGGDTDKGFNYRVEQAVKGVKSPISISCGDVYGDVSAGANVTCGDVGGEVNAGCDVHCGDVNGPLTAGCDVRCSDVNGPLTAGCDVECGQVAGPVHAGCDVRIRK